MGGWDLVGLAAWYSSPRCPDAGTEASSAGSRFFAFQCLSLGEGCHRWITAIPSASDLCDTQEYQDRQWKMLLSARDRRAGWPSPHILLDKPPHTVELSLAS